MTVNKKGPFSEEQFTSTQYDSASDKATWANKMASWITQGFPENGWNKSLYHHLSLHMYGHIAHYNQHGFYAEWFADIHRQVQWLEHATSCRGVWSGMADPAYTWCDVERAMSAWIRDSGLLNHYQQLCAQDIERRERAQLAYLQRKYAPPEKEPDNGGEVKAQKEPANASPRASDVPPRPTPALHRNRKQPAKYQEYSLFDIPI